MKMLRMNHNYVNLNGIGWIFPAFFGFLETSREYQRCKRYKAAFYKSKEVLIL